MAKIKLTKNELKKQKDDLKRFTRYLPTLELKKKQLLAEIRQIQNVVDKLQAEVKQVDKHVNSWADVFAEDVDLNEMFQVVEIKTGVGNIAGIDIPLFEDVTFEDMEYDFLIDETVEDLDTGRLLVLLIRGKYLEGLGDPDVHQGDDVPIHHRQDPVDEQGRLLSAGRPEGQQG